MNRAAPDPKRATFHIVLIFLCGALSGVVGARAWVKWSPWSAAASSSGQLSFQDRVARFSRELELTPEQVKQLNPILDETHASLREEESRLNEVRQKSRQRILEILTDKQKVKFEEILARNESRRKLHQKRQ